MPETRFEAEAVIDEFERLSEDAGRVQRETLKKILEENGETEYLSKFGLNGRTDPQSFKACVPIVTHSDLQPYIKRIADGEDQHASILTAKPISAISLRFFYFCFMCDLIFIIYLCIYTMCIALVVLVPLKGSQNT